MSQGLTFTASGQRQLIPFAGSNRVALFMHIRSTSTMSNGTISVQYPVVDNPDLTNDAHWETLETLSGLTAGNSRPIRWPGKLACVLIAASGGPNVFVDFSTMGV